MRNLVAFIMRKEGFKVTAAEDGLDGLEKLYTDQQVDLIITDINMPRMDGITFIKTVREQDIYRDIPIVVLSTEGEERDIHFDTMYDGQGASMALPIWPAGPTSIWSSPPSPRSWCATSRCFWVKTATGPKKRREVP